MHHRVQKKEKKGVGRSSKVIPKGMQSTTKLQKVVPKGAQHKFSAQKSFLRECRAKYRRNIRRRSSKVVPKGMQNLHRKVNGDTAEIEGEEVQKTFLRECRTYTKKSAVKPKNKQQRTFSHSQGNVGYG